jgi:histidine triad (HIT) family protein
MTTIFEEIIHGKIPAEKVFESEQILVIKDKYPVAPVHLLILPKKNFSCLQQVPLEDISIIAEIMSVTQQLAREFHIENDYRLLTNNGPKAGQSIFYLHFHLVGGTQLGPIA